MATALVQAGGKSERMRRTAGPVHKALLPVLGVPLLERNLCQLLASGFDSIVVATSQAEGEITDYVAGRGAQLAACRGAELRCSVEPQPLGTIGAAGMLAAGDCPILVVYADNLTSLDMRALVEHHSQAGAAMTLATHEEPFKIPFGEVVARDGRVVDYREKSVHPIRISSGIYVLSPAALACLPPGERFDSPHLVLRLLEQGAAVADYPHNELWLDMNDADSLASLERMIMANPQRLDWLRPQADREGVLTVTQRGEDGAACVDTVERVQPLAADDRALGSFDEIDASDGRIVRWHVRLAAQTEKSPTAAATFDRGEAGDQRSRRDRRALAYAAHYLSTLAPANE